MHVIPLYPAARSRGFSLIEVMVAVLVISIGLLGIAKMQALALSSTGSARLRSLAALEASSLASTMGADRTYWLATPAAGAHFTVTVQGTAITSPDTTLTATQSCVNGVVCTVAQMASFDLQNWVANLSTLIPNEGATVDCFLPTAASPTTCTITITWSENLVASNAQEAGGTMAAPTYTLVVQP
jgi:type IV pilus assembly protein PilV